MNPERLLAHYERLADAPNGIVRFRSFVRDLAMRGKLMPQSAADVAAEELTMTPGIPKSGARPFEIPVGWKWVSVDSVAATRLGKMLDKVKNKGTPRRYLRNINVRWFDFDLSDLFEMPFEDSELAEFALRAGDVLICEGGEPGRAAVWDERRSDIYFQKAIHRVRFTKQVDPHYFVQALRASADDGRLSQYFTGTGIQHFTGRGLASFLFPLPPVGEQKQIVAKLDELMKLCDRLEAARSEREATRDRLSASSLDRLNSPDAATFRDDARFVLNALPALTARADQIKQIRQTILNLAVRGKLVAQEPGDEPAEELLKRVASAKARLARRGRARQNQSAIEQARGAILPSSWTAAPLSELATVVNGRAYAQNELLEAGTPVLRVGNLFTSKHWYYSTLQLDEDKYCEAGDLIFAWSASFGPFIWQGPKVIYHYHIWKLVLHSEADLDKHYLYNVLLERTQKIKESGHGISMVHMTKEKMELLEIPVPPFAEQRRIVAKVDELMALCDRLEASLTDADISRGRLLEAVLGEAVGT